MTSYPPHEAVQMDLGFKAAVRFFENCGFRRKGWAVGPAPREGRVR